VITSRTKTNIAAQKETDNTSKGQFIYLTAMDISPQRKDENYAEKIDQNSAHNS